MAEQYVIRGTHWGYNDETYYPSGSYIHSVFNDKKSAIKKLDALEIAYWREIDFGEIDEFFDGDQDLVDEVNEFTLKECNIKTFEDPDDIRDSYIPEELSDKDVLTLLKIIDLQSYKLVVFDEKQKFHVLFFLGKQQYLTIPDESSSSLIYSTTALKLTQEVKKHDEIIRYYYLNDRAIKIKGALEKLSDNPTALAEIVNKTRGLFYSKGSSYLEIQPKIKLLFLVNDLLKNPFFEIQALSLKKIKKIEKKL